MFRILINYRVIRQVVPVVCPGGGSLGPAYYPQDVFTSSNSGGGDGSGGSTTSIVDTSALIHLSGSSLKQAEIGEACTCLLAIYRLIDLYFSRGRGVGPLPHLSN